MSASALVESEDVLRQLFTAWNIPYTYKISPVSMSKLHNTAFFTVEWARAIPDSASDDEVVPDIRIPVQFIVEYFRAPDDPAQKPRPFVPSELPFELSPLPTLGAPRLSWRPEGSCRVIGVISSGERLEGEVARMIEARTLALSKEQYDVMVADAVAARKRAAEAPAEAP
jgi:hypothetical protein